MDSDNQTTFNVDVLEARIGAILSGAEFYPIDVTNALRDSLEACARVRKLEEDIKSIDADRQQLKKVKDVFERWYDWLEDEPKEAFIELANALGYPNPFEDDGGQ